MKAVILAAGNSSKLAPFSDSRPKSMILISGELILERLLKQVKEAGISEVCLVVGHKGAMIEEAFHFGKALGLKISYQHQTEKSGIGAALSLAQGFIGNDTEFLLLFGDCLASGNNVTHLLRQAQSRPQKNLAMITHPNLEGAYGNIYLGHEMKIQRLVEKPLEGERHSNYILGGSFLFQTNIFAELASLHHDMVALYQRLISQGLLEASLWEDEWIDISRPWHILDANRMIMSTWRHSIIPASAEIDPGVHLQGPVHLGEKVRISAGATLVGPCYIGDGCFIGHSTLIRDHSSIGPGSVIGYGTEVKNSVLFGHSTVGRLSYIGDSVIGEAAHLGSGTMTVNTNYQEQAFTLDLPEGPVSTGRTKVGAFLGDRCLIGAGHILKPGTLVAPGQVWPDHFTNPA